MGSGNGKSKGNVSGKNAATIIRKRKQKVQFRYQKDLAGLSIGGEKKLKKKDKIYLSFSQSGTVLKTLELTPHQKNIQEIDISDLSGSYELVVSSTPKLYDNIYNYGEPEAPCNKCDADNIYWPLIGDCDSHRIWHKLKINVVVEKHIINSIDDVEFAEISKGMIRFYLRPIWTLSVNKNERPATSNEICEEESLEIEEKQFKTDIKVENIQKKFPNYPAPAYIVVHHTAGPKDIPPHFIYKKSTGGSAHYVIGKNGDIVKMVHESEASHHAGTSEWEGLKKVNDFTIGIEIVHNDFKKKSDKAKKKHQNYDDKQYETLIMLIKQLLNYSDIPAHRVIGHSDIGVWGNTRRVRKEGGGTKSAPTPKYLIGANGRKAACPGICFEWDKLINEGIGIIPADISKIYRIGSTPYDIESDFEPLPDTIYGKSLKNRGKPDYEAVCKDLSIIGYHTPDINLLIKESKAEQKKFKTHFNFAVHAFKLHFCRIGKEKQNTKFDYNTALMLKRVTHTMKKHKGLI